MTNSPACKPAFLYLAEYQCGIFRVGQSKSSTPNLRQIKPYRGQRPRRIVGGGAWRCHSSRVKATLRVAEYYLQCGKSKQLPGGFHGGQKADVVRDVSAAAWLENGDTVTALLKQRGVQVPPRCVNGNCRLVYCKLERDPILIGLHAASMGINPHCILTNQKRLLRSVRKGDHIICLAPDKPSKAAMRYLASECVVVEFAPRPRMKYFSSCHGSARCQTASDQTG